MLTCKEVLDNLSCYVDGEGSEELRRELEDHIARCVQCFVILDTTKQSLRIVADCEPFEVPLATSARLYDRLAHFFASLL